VPPPQNNYVGARISSPGSTAENAEDLFNKNKTVGQRSKGQSSNFRSKARLREGGGASRPKIHAITKTGKMKQQLQILTVVALCACCYLLGLWHQTSTAAQFPKEHGGAQESSVPVLAAGKTTGALLSQRSAITELLAKYGRDRKLVAVLTDRPVYRPGDVVWVRGVVLDAVHRGFQRNGAYFDPPETWRILGPRGEELARGWVGGLVSSSSLGFKWEMPSGLPGGEYALEVLSSQWTTPARRPFRIQSYRQSSMVLKIAPTADLYGYGEEVEMILTYEWARGGEIQGASARIIATVDDDTVFESEVDHLLGSRAIFSFTLPKSWELGSGVLTAIVTGPGGIVESASATLPLFLSSLRVDVYPEGGVLVTGLPSRLYVAASLPNGEPAEFRGSVVLRHSDSELDDDDDDHVVADVASLHEGRGVSEIFVTPPLSPSSFVALRMESPSRMIIPVDSNLITSAGASLISSQQAYAAEEAISFSVLCTSDVHQPLRLGLYKRETEIASAVVKMDSQGGSQSIVLTPAVGPSSDGVLRATLWDSEGLPLAERLIFRHPAHWMNLEVYVSVLGDADSEQQGENLDAPFTAAPAAKVRLDILATYETGAPASDAVIGLTVTDSRNFARGHHRKLPPRLPAAILLESEVLDLEDARAFSFQAPELHRVVSEKDVPLDLRLDLLMGTQGWRRFAYSGPDGPLGFLKDGDGSQEQKQIMLGVGQGSYYVGRARNGGNVMFKMGGGEAFLEEDEGVVLERGAFANMAEMIPVAAMDAVAHEPMMAAAAYAAPPVFAEAGSTGFDGADMSAADIATSESTADELPPLFEDADEQVPWREEEDMAGWDDGDAVAPGDHGDILLKLVKEQRIRMPRSPDNWDFQRVFAHTRPRSNHNDAQLPRSDKTDTVFFAAALETDDRGRASATFYLSDLICTYDIAVDGITPDGSLGEGAAELRSVKPVSVDVSLPPTLVEGDSVSAPISTTVLTHKLLRGRKFPLVLEVSLSSSLVFSDAEVGAWNVQGSIARVKLEQVEETHRIMLPTFTAASAGMASITVQLAGEGAISDAISQEIRVGPRGFPVMASAAGFLTIDGSEMSSMPLHLPLSILPGSLSMSFLLYPSPIASLNRALETFVREPCGCFEQTSSTTYPLALAIKYLESSGPSAEENRAAHFKLLLTMRQKLEKGLAILLGYESEGGGFEWFGRAPGHDSLTAYAILQFTDMADVIQKPAAAVIDRTRRWLLERMSPDGSFRSSSDGLDSFGYAPTDITHAYLVYALLSSGTPASELGPAVDRLRSRMLGILLGGHATIDSYELALGVQVLHIVDGVSSGVEDALALAKVLASRQVADGRIGGALSSITCSQGHSLDVETTSLAVLSWLRFSGEEFTGSVQAGIKWLAEASKDGRFGSTQGSVLALKAIIAYELSHRSASSSILARLSLLDSTRRQVVAPAVVTISSSETDMHDAVKVEVGGLVEALQPGSDYIFQLEGEKLDDSETENGGGTGLTSVPRIPWTGAVMWRSEQGTDSPLEGSALDIITTLSTPILREGESVSITVIISNIGSRKTGMLVASIGVPAGLETRMDRLSELKGEGVIASYELRDEAIDIYWDGLQPHQQSAFSFDLLASIPGSFTAQASRIFEYYGESEKWTEGLYIQVTP
jgi:hypothetical protein